MTGYATYRERCKELEREMEELRAEVGGDASDVTLRWCLDSAAALLGVARLIATLRCRDEAVPKPTPSEAPHQ